MSITGYRELSEEELSTINKLQDLAEIVGLTVTLLARDSKVDQRWLALANAYLDKGFVALTRSITKPTTF